MPVTNTDAVLWYNVERFGQLGYAVPNPSNDPGSLNQNILDLVKLVGSNLFNIMHHEDVDLRIPPSINTILRVHKLYVRFGQLLQARMVKPSELNMETQHVSPGGEVFMVYPVPYFLVRNDFMKRWAGWVMMMLAEAMQHTENRKSIEISTNFAGLMGQYMTRVYRNMATELFGKKKEDVMVDGFILTDADFQSYDPSLFFTSTEMTDTVPNLGAVFTEDALKVLRQGIPVTSLPDLQPWPTNLTNYYQATVGDPSATDYGFETKGATTDAQATAGGGPVIPKPPAP